MSRTLPPTRRRMSLKETTRRVKRDNPNRSTKRTTKRTVRKKVGKIRIHVTVNDGPITIGRAIKKEKKDV